MKYVRSYDIQFDEYFQIEIDDEEATKLTSDAVSDTPWPNVPIKSRYRSERHPGWDKEDD